MTDESLSDPHWRRQAESIAAHNAKMSSFAVPADETIEKHSHRHYLAPQFVRKAAGESAFGILQGLLDELCLVDELFIGHTCGEAEVYLCVTGQTLHLTDRLRDWVHAYIEHRLSTKGYLPDDHRDPFRRFHRLVNELDNVLEQLSLMKNSVSYVFVGPAIDYGRWLIYCQTWKPLLVKTGTRIELAYIPYVPGTVDTMRDILDTFGWEEAVRDFAEQVMSSTGQSHCTALRDETVDSLLEEIGEYASQIQEMRPFLADVSAREKARIQLVDGSFLIWDWSVRHGIANLAFVRDEHQLYTFATTSTSSAAAIVTLDGIIVDYFIPWQAMHDLSIAPKLSLLALNRFLLRQFWEKLSSFYVKIDFDRIRGRRASAPLEDPVTEEEFALACQDVSAGDLSIEQVVEQPRGAKARIRSLNLSRILSKMRDCFGVETRQGKGSEIVVYRKGWRSFIFGCHGRDRTVSTPQIKMSLRKLGLSAEDWCQAVYKA